MRSSILSPPLVLILSPDSHEFSRSLSLSHSLTLTLTLSHALYPSTVIVTVPVCCLSNFDYFWPVPFPYKKENGKQLQMKDVPLNCARMLGKMVRAIHVPISETSLALGTYLLRGTQAQRRGRSSGTRDA